MSGCVWGEVGGGHGEAEDVVQYETLLRTPLQSIVAKIAYLKQCFGL